MGSNVEAIIEVKLIKQPKGFTGAKPDLGTIHSDLCDIVKTETFTIGGNNFTSQPECRWNTIDEDMRKLSIMYPGILFMVRWNVPDYGEDPVLDYFYEGKTQRAVITYSPFDESLLN